MESDEGRSPMESDGVRWSPMREGGVRRWAALPRPALLGWEEYPIPEDKFFPPPTLGGGASARRSRAASPIGETRGGGETRRDPRRSEGGAPGRRG